MHRQGAPPWTRLQEGAIRPWRSFFQFNFNAAFPVRILSSGCAFCISISIWTSAIPNRGLTPPKTHGYVASLQPKSVDVKLVPLLSSLTAFPADIALWDLIEALCVAIFNGLLCVLVLGMLDQRTLGWLTGVHPSSLPRRTTTAMLEAGDAKNDNKYRIFQIKFWHRIFFGVMAGLVSFVVSFLSLMLGITFYPASIMAAVSSGLIVTLGVRFSGTLHRS